MSKSSYSKILSAVAVFLAFLLVVPAAQGNGCFSIVVGKDASADGYVIMAHNEDDTPPQIVNHYKIPRIRHTAGEKVELINGGKLDQVEETWAYIWSEMPDMLFSDSYINEWGVSIASDNCPSREDQPEITDGGISYMLRRLVVERAKSAREGVLLAGDLVERFGYDASGRTYIICDPEEGWFFCAINGKHWLARRVPDGEVAMVANTFSVHEVDLSDENHFLASPDMIEYAVSRGWYDPQRDGSFDFADVYADPQVASDSSNFCRQRSGLHQVAAQPIPLDQALPFSVKPQNKLDITMVMDILRDHYEGTELYQASIRTGSPYESRHNTICNWTTQTSFVVQLRRSMPLDIGIVYWVCLKSPCTSFFIPFHFGITKFPDGFCLEGDITSTDSYEETPESPFEVDILRAFSTFESFHNKVDNAYGSVIIRLKPEYERFERRAIALQKPLEQAVLQLYPVDKSTAQEMLTNYSNGLYLSAMETLERVLSEK